MHLLFFDSCQGEKEKRGNVILLESRYPLVAFGWVLLCFRIGWDLNQRIFIGSHTLKAALREAD